jgi:prevent-host-death family protein
MDHQYIGLAEARTQLAELVGRVTYGGARIVLTKHGKPAAALVPIEDLQRLGTPTEPVLP